MAKRRSVSIRTPAALRQDANLPFLPCLSVNFLTCASVRPAEACTPKVDKTWSTGLAKAFSIFRDVGRLQSPRKEVMDMGEDSPSSRSFLAQEPKREPGCVGMRSRSWGRDARGERWPAVPGGEQMQPSKCRRNGRVLVVVSKEEEATGGAAELKPTDLGINPSTCQELDKCRQAGRLCYDVLPRFSRYVWVGM